MFYCSLWHAVQCEARSWIKVLGQRMSDQRQGPGAEHHGHLGSRVLMACKRKESDVPDLKNCITEQGMSGWDRQMCVVAVMGLKVKVFYPFFPFPLSSSVNR